MTSPFAKARFEHESAHRYYLPSDIIPTLEEFKPSYVLGSRGSGKTTLLKSLTWRERTSNPHLREQLGDPALRNSFIACYTKLPKTQVRSLDRWLADCEDDTYGTTFAYYLDLATVELVASALAKLILEQRFTIPPEDEATRLTDWAHEVGTFIGPARDPLSTAWLIRTQARDRRRFIEACARQRVPVDTLLEDNALPDIGSLSRSFAEVLASLLDRHAAATPSWHFKVCMDEAEVLSLRQQQTLNTLVRLAEWPMTYVIAFVGRPNDATTTLLPNLTQQKADRTVIQLDELESSRFREYCDGVATVRIRALTTPEAPSFSTAAFLGPLDLNGLVAILVDRSESRVAEDLRDMATRFSSEWAAARAGNGLPYVEAYIADRLELGAPDGGSEERRRQESAEFRKRIVAAYLSICRELRVQSIPYASSNMVFGISDGCVRDYLSQMDHIVREAELPERALGTSSVGWEQQSLALHRASDEKRESIPVSGVHRPVQAGRLVRGLGHLTGLLQHGDAGNMHLRSSDRGWFLVDRLSELGELRGLVEDAADAGFLKLRVDEDQVSMFRVHASLAPSFGFSYRGPSYAVRLRAEEATGFAECRGDRELQLAAARAYRRINSSDGDPLQRRFDFSGNDDGGEDDGGAR